MKKRILASLLAVCIVVTMLPLTALADEGDTGTTATTLPVADENGVITLTGNVTATLTVNQNDNIILDLNGHTLTNTDGQHTIINNGTLTIKDTSTDDVGTVDNVSHAKAAIMNNNGAICTILAGQFTRSLENGQSGTDNGGNSYYTINNYGTMTFGEENGTNDITVTAEGYYSSLVHNGWQNSSDAQDKTATMTIHGGTFTGGINTIKNDESGTLTINGGTFNNVTQYAVQNWNKATINGGTFESNTMAAVFNGAGTQGTSDGQLTINGGDFTSTDGATIYTDGSGAKTTIEGGTFTANSTTTDTYYVTFTYNSATTEINGGTYSNKYVGNTYDYENDNPVVVNENGTCEVKTEDEVTNLPQDSTGRYYADTDAAEANNAAKVTSEDGTTYYASLSAAINAASDGDTVTLLNNTSISNCISVSKSITIDLNGKTLTGPSQSTEDNGEGWAFKNDGAVKVEVKDGTINSYKGFNWNNGSLTLTDVALTTTERAIGNYNDSTVTVGAGSTVSSTGYVAIVVWGDADGSKAPTLNVYGTVTATTRGKAAISGNGTDYSGTTISIYDGAYVKSASIAIYHPQPGTLNISGGTIEGYCGIGIKSGDLNISGGTIRGTADDDELSDSNSTSNGIVTDGSAIVVDSNTAYAGQMNISISDDAVIESLYSTAIREIGKDEETTSVVSLTVAADSDVKIISAEGKDPIQMREATTENVTLSGGNYSDSVNPDYLDDSLTAELVKSSGDAPYSYYTNIEAAQKDATANDIINDLSVQEEAGATYYKVTLDYNDGERAKEITPVELNNTFKLPTPIRSGYTFQSWSDDTTTYPGGAAYEVKGTVTLTAQWEKNVTGVTLSSTKLSLVVDGTETLTATVEPTDALDKTVTWSSSNPEVATVNNGVVTAVGVGKTIITVTTADGSKTATCEVTVTAKPVPVESVTVSPEKLNLYVGKSEQLTATLTPADTTNAKYQWISSDETVATVDENGVVTAVGKGEATITVIVTAEGETATATCTVTVSKRPVDDDYADPTYSISVPKADNGTVRVNTKEAAEGDLVTITVKPDEGYEIDEVTVTDRRGHELRVRDKGDGKYTFLMPASRVTVSVSFAEIEPEVTVPVGVYIPVSVANLPFTDVPEYAWYSNAVLYVCRNDLMNGVSTYRFAPEAVTSRGMIVTILYRLEGEPAVGASAFTDVAPGAWYARAAAWAAANGIVNGYGDGTFGPNDDITREQLAAILYRYAAYRSCDVSARTGLYGYADANQVSGYAADAMSWANAAGLITGVTADTLVPQGHATRAEVAVILTRFCENFVK